MKVNPSVMDDLKISGLPQLSTPAMDGMPAIVDNNIKQKITVDDFLNPRIPMEHDTTSPSIIIGIKTKLKKYYENITISSDFDGLDDPLDLFASPRMYPVMALYVANRLKWDLYRRYYGKMDDGTSLIEGNDNIGPERGQTLNVDDGAFYDPISQTYGLNAFQRNNLTEAQLDSTLSDIVKDIMKQILDTNFINMVAKARGWA